MKFKPTLLLASMVAAGALVTAPAFAGGSHSSAKAADAAVSRMEAVMNRSQNNVKTGRADFAKDWAHKIHVSGQMNVDASYSSNNFAGENRSVTPTGGVATNRHRDNVITRDNSSSDFAINNADLFIDADLNDWTVAHIGLEYRQNRADTVAVQRLRTTGTNFDVQEAYVSMHNFSQSPFYFNFGKQFLDFGNNTDHNPMFNSLTQMMTETNATAATFGMVSNMGLNGSVSVFRGLRDDDHDDNNPKTRVNNGTINLGFDGEADGFNYHLGAGYMYDVSSAHYVAYRILHASSVTDGAVKHPVGAWDLNANIASGPFYGSAEYVKTDRKYGLNSTGNYDLQYKSKGAQPSAWDIMAGYKFKTASYDSSVELSYQHSSQASGNGSASTNVSYWGLYLPENRYQAIYNVAAYKHTNIGFGLVRDVDYSVTDGGTGKNTTSATIRVGVEFA